MGDVLHAWSGEGGTNTLLLLSMILLQQQARNALVSRKPQDCFTFSLQVFSAAIKTCPRQSVLLAEQPEIRQKDELWAGCRNTCAKHTPCHGLTFPW